MFKNLWYWFLRLIGRRPTLKTAQKRLDQVKKMFKDAPVYDYDRKRTPLQKQLIRMGYRKISWI